MLGLLKKKGGGFEVGLNSFCVMRFPVIYGDKSGRLWLSGLSS